MRSVNGRTRSSSYRYIKLTCTFVSLLTQQPNTGFGENAVEVVATKVGRYTDRTGRRRERERDREGEGGENITTARADRSINRSEPCANW